MDAETFAGAAARTAVQLLPMSSRRCRWGSGASRRATGCDLAGASWDVRIGNGHAPEHATFWSSDDDLVIGGDQMLASISPNLGVYATEPEADPVGEWLEACERLRPFARDSQLVLPGHKLPFTGLAGADAAADRQPPRRARPAAAGAGPAAWSQSTVSPLFKRHIGEGEYGLALVEAMAHLNHLYHLGQVTRARRDDGAWVWQAKGACDGR